jgi:hypothetical protein
MRFLRRSKSNGDSEKALADAQRHLSEVKKRGPEVSSVANSLKDFREKNHLMEKFEEIFIIKKVSSNDS